MPKEGERLELTYQGYEFRILKVENKMIQTVQAVKLARPAGTEKEEES
ncbi:MAG: transporter associated domain-containing protein [Lachnospiraceae bacterium]|nr:transporter associated domain-containing protein [Lachnospiraceae bacterium]